MLQEINELRKQLTVTESEVIAQTRQLEMVSRELEQKRKILNTITQVATSQMS